MKGVVDDIIVRALPDGKRWELFEDFEWYGLVVPKGFTTDFASVPRWAWWYINPTGRIKPAAIVHDWLYYNLGRVLVNGSNIKMTRGECDYEFLTIMERIGIGWLKRHSAHKAVRAGGWYGWNKRKRELENK